MLARTCAVLVLALAWSLLGPASLAGARSPAASRLAAKDPGALSGGSTIVVTKPRVRVFGVPRRSNHVAALGAGASVYGGARADELAARGPRVTLRGRGGRDVIHGGRDGTLIGGPGADLLTAARSGATVRAGPRDVVLLRGRGARVVCRSGTRGLVVLRRPRTRVDPACRRGDVRIGKLRTGSARRPASRATVVTGDGSNANPFTAPCDDPGGVDCTVSAFAARPLSGSWKNEYVPAYECPTDHPYLLNKVYSPPFTSWGFGVEIQEDESVFPINVSISGQRLLDPPLANVFGGTYTGFPNSSATNWLWGGSHWYKAVLHCTSDKCRSTDNVGPPPGCDGAARAVGRRAFPRGRP
jgi:hypothetical protein